LSAATGTIGDARPAGAGALAVAVHEAARAAATQLARRRPGATAVRELARLCAGPPATDAAGARRLALALGEAADESRCGLLLAIDDVDRGGDDAFAVALSAASRRALPCLLLTSARPGFDPDEEFVHVDLGPLGEAELGELLAASRGPERRSEDGAGGVELVDRLADCSDGWPGLAGAMAAAPPERWPQLLEQVVGERLRHLAPAERRYLETVAHLPAPVSATSVARALGDSTRFGGGGSTLEATREALVQAGLLVTPGPDQVALALVGTAAWLRRR
jgi:hypothetical protein